jgi:hypothetical protein
MAADLRAIFNKFPTAKTPNESQTEDDLIWPILARLDWTASLRQQNLAARVRDDVPDGLLFQDAAAKAEANAFGEEWKRYGCGLAIVESKRWQRPLDRQSGRRGEETAPSTQMLRYLRRVEDLTTGKLTRLRVESAGRIIPGVTVEPFPRHPFHEVRRQAVPPSRQFFRPVLEQPPEGEGFFTIRKIRERRDGILRRPGPQQGVEGRHIVTLDIGPRVRHVFFVSIREQKIPL